MSVRRGYPHAANNTNGMYTGADDWPNSSVNYATADYTNVWGVDPGLYSGNGLSPPGALQGLISQPAASIAAVSDGLSNTIAATECSGRPQLWQAGTLASGSETGILAGGSSNT